MKKIILIFSIIAVMLGCVSCAGNSSANLLSKEIFSHIKEGSTFAEVKKLDGNSRAIKKSISVVHGSDTRYYIDYESYHQTKDGSLIIKYVLYCEDMSVEELENYYDESKIIVKSLEWGV